MSAPIGASAPTAQAEKFDYKGLKTPSRLPKPNVEQSSLPAELIDGLRQAGKHNKPTEDDPPACGIFGKDNNCQNLLNELAANKDANSTADLLGKLQTYLNTHYAANMVSVTQIIADVKSMHPKVVAAILANIGFNTVKEHMNFAGVDVEMLCIEKVSEWKKRTMENAPPAAKPLGQTGGADIMLSADRLLEIFREWVNANPTTLNPEFDPHRKNSASRYNEVDKSFNLYDRKNPKLALRLSDYKTGLRRINLGISSGNIGYTPSLYTNVPTSMAFAQSLNPELFFNSKMTGLPAMIQSGGDDGENYKKFEEEVFNNSGSYINLTEIYGFFKKIIDSNSGAMKLSDNSTAKINNALTKLNEGEKELKESYTRFLARKRIYDASRGTVKIDDNDADVEDKINQYSNYLKRAEMVNKQTKKVTAMLYNLADSITVLITNPSSKVMVQ